MRLAGTTVGQQEAQRFADYLLTLEIETKVMQEPDGWGIWVRDEVYLPEVKEEFIAFIENPQAKIYDAATSVAHSIRKQDQQKVAQSKKLQVDVKSSWDTSPPTNFPVTIILIVIVMTLECISLFDDDRRKIIMSTAKGFGFDWYAVFWVPFTSTLVHITPLIHAGFNMMFLYRFGSRLENWMGTAKFLGLILILAYTSSICSVLGGSYGFGFSGVVYGLFGYLLVGRRYRNDLAIACPQSTAQALKVWFFICIFLTYAEIMPIDNIAHGAGWLFGFLYAKAVFEIRNKAAWIWAAVLTTQLVLLPFYIGIIINGTPLIWFWK